MKFVTFLKDSYREAVSGWVLQVMLALATLLILVIASTSFERVSLQEDLRPKIDALNVIGFLTGNSSSRFSLENFQQTNDAAEPWQGNYQFDVVIRSPSEKDLDALRSNSQLPTSRRRLEEFITNSQVTPYLKNVVVSPGKVEDAEPRPKNPDAPNGAAKEEAKPPATSGPKVLRFTVTTEGTKIENRLAWPHSATVLFGLLDIPGIMSLREWVYNLETTLVNDIGAWIIVLMGVVITAGFVPTIMQKGAVDLLISKPVSRFRLLLFKYLGGLTFVFLLVSYTALGTWLIIGLRFNFWSPNFLAIIPILTFYFAVLYSVSVLMAVLTRSTIVAILVTVLAWGLFTLIGWGNRVYDDTMERYHDLQSKLEQVGAAGVDAEGQPLPTQQLLDKTKPSSYTTAAHYAHYLTPRTYELDKRAARIIAYGILTDLELKKRGYDKAPKESWGQIVGMSLAFIVVMLALAYWRFATRDG